MTPADALLRAILDKPDDDTPRLVYADWLEEQGDPRGDFIRVQVALSRLDEDAPEREQLQQRERALLEAHRDEWLGGVADLVTEPHFARGFVERASLGTRQFLTHAPKLFALTPLREVKLLRLSQTRDGAAELADCPYLGRLRGLDFANSAVGDDRLATVLRSPHVAGLTTLRLAGTGAGDAVMAALRGEARRNVRVLDLASNYLGARLAALLAPGPLAALESLGVSDNGLTAADVRRMARWPALATLRDLSLANNVIRVGGAERLAISPHLRRLTRLDLRNCAIGVRGTRALAGTAALAGLRALDMSGNACRVSGLRALIDSPHFPALTRLNLGGNGLGDEGVGALAEWERLSRLRALALWNNGIGDAGVTALAGSRHATNLRELDLTFNDVGDEAVRLLAESPYLEQLTSLNLSRNFRLTEHGLRALLESPCLPRLKFLRIDFVPVGEAFRAELQKRFNLGQQLRWPGPFGDGVSPT
jgi:uncharacterized protein (TIGR02996 family)